MSAMWPPGGEPVQEWPEEQPAARPADLPRLLDPVEPEDDAEPEDVSLADMLASGATYRQLDYWWRTGLFDKSGAPQPQHIGTGNPRRWTQREQQIATLMMRLIRTGIATGLAARMARDSVDNGARRVTTEDGITISWSGVA